MIDATPPQHATRISGLDGLRAISILLVLFGHGWFSFPFANRLRRLEPYLGNSVLGVTTFFVISGFLITYLLRREWEKTGTIRLQDFYMRRVLRIFPALYTYLGFLLVIRSLGWIQTTLGDLGMAAIFLTNYKHLFSIPTNPDYWFVGHFWTLSLEEQFYLFWPPIILAFGLRRAPVVATFLVIASPLVRVISYFAFARLRPQLGIMLHSAADPIMFGCLAALWQGHPSFEALLKRFSAWYWPVLAGLFVSIGSAWLGIRFRGSYYLSVGITLNSLAITLIMLWVIRRPTSLFGRFLSTPILRHIGVLSYSLYLWQQPFLTDKNHTILSVFPYNLITCFVIAELSYWFIESPFLRLRSRFRHGEQPKSPSVASRVEADPGPGQVASEETPTNGVLHNTSSPTN